MSLKLYDKKRNFNDTSEPKGKIKKQTTKRLAFVVQRHKASHLHYDFRLEMEGVLKSWAVPKGPSLHAADKRLAMMVEDHPYDYKDFSGEIPEGNYGAGIVEIWDEGYYTDIDESDYRTAEKNLLAGLKAGNLKFKLFGKKLNGEFALVKLKKAEDNAWLLIKHKDEYAVEGPYNSEDDTPAESPINQWLQTQSKGSKKKSVKAVEQRSITEPVVEKKMEHFIPAMLAQTGENAFDDEDWLFEIKWDGYRAIAELSDSDVKIYSRNGLVFNDRYPETVDALKKLKLNAVLDGELTVLNEDGLPDFQKLQHYSEFRSFPLVYNVFDILFHNGEDVTGWPLIDRKELLKKLLPNDDIIKFSDHIQTYGTAFFDAIKERKMEGIMAKRANSLYYPGKRTADWLKIKYTQTEEAIIVGFTEPTGSRKYFGALVLALKKGNELIYAGHTGTGFDASKLKEVYEKLKPLSVNKSPLSEKVKTNTPVSWVKPVLVCELKFTEVTKDGKFRHPVFLHLREDKDAADVTTQNIEAASSVSPGKKSASSVKKRSTNKKAEGKDAILKAGKYNVTITNKDKVYFPESGITKLDVAAYYDAISELMLPYLKNRPQSLKRNPNGIGDKGFYHKDAGDEAPEFASTFEVASSGSNKPVNYIVCNNKATLLYMANLGCIEINPWHSTTKKPDHPDYFIIDIDPSEKNTLSQIVDAALAVKQVLDKIGAPSFIKTSGATGLHIYVPTGAKYTYDQVKEFARIVCTYAQQLVPEFTTLERNIKKRGTHRIYLDYLQNNPGQTIASVYSIRPRPGATVSTPLEWSEVNHKLVLEDYNIDTILERVKTKGDLFNGVLGKGIDMMKCLKKLNAL